MELNAVLLHQDHYNSKEKEAKHQAEADREEQEAQFFPPQGTVEPWEKDPAQEIKERVAAMA